MLPMVFAKNIFRLVAPLPATSRTLNGARVIMSG